MATVSKSLADKLRANNGYYADDPRVQRIIKYIDACGKEAYGIEYARDIGKYSASEYVNAPEVYWQV